LKFHVFDTFLSLLFTFYHEIKWKIKKNKIHILEHQVAPPGPFLVRGAWWAFWCFPPSSSAVLNIMSTQTWFQITTRQSPIPMKLPAHFGQLGAKMITFLIKMRQNSQERVTTPILSNPFWTTLHPTLHSTCLCWPTWRHWRWSVPSTCRSFACSGRQIAEPRKTYLWILFFLKTVSQYARFVSKLVFI